MVGTLPVQELPVQISTLLAEVDKALVDVDIAGLDLVLEVEHCHVGICKKHCPFNHIFGADRILGA